jgi:hypothetical protein
VRASGPPQIVYRETVALSLHTGGADRLLVDPASTQLSASFAAHEFDARSGTLAATIAPLGGTALEVTVEAPRQVVRARTGRVSTYATELLRLDGGKLAEPPTATAAQNADMPGPPRDFTDAHFAVRFRAAGALVSTLVPADLSALVLRSYPSGPRFGIVLGGSAAPAEVFWQQAGEVRGTATASAGALLAQALQAQLDRIEGPLPATVDAVVVIESDAPCTVNVSALAVAYSLVRDRFVVAPPADPTRATLRLTGSAGDSGSVSFQLPRSAVPRSAGLALAEAFLPPGAGDAGAARAALEQRYGVDVAAGAWTALQVTTPGPRALAAVELGLLALETPTELQLELRADAGGEPAGRALTSSSFTLAGAGARAWLALGLPGVSLLPSAPLWLLVSATRGRAVWLADPAAASSAPAVRRLNTAPPETPLDVPGEALVPALRLHDIEPPGGAAGPEPALALSLDDVAVTLPAADQDVRRVDFTAALGAQLPDAGVTGTVDLQLELSATAPASVLIKDLDVRYDLPV